MHARLLALVVPSLLSVVGCDKYGHPVDPEGPGLLACGIAPLVFDAFGDVVQGESDEGCARVERRAVDLGDDFICKACPYDPVRLVVSVGERFVDVRAGDEGVQLAYEATHHNWSDVVTATFDDGDVARVQVLYDAPVDEWVLNVAFDAEGADAVRLPAVPR